jgi:hypothetical protein
VRLDVSGDVDSFPVAVCHAALTISSPHPVNAADSSEAQPGSRHISPVQLP